MVNGVAAGAGFNIVLACDIVICAKSARFAQSFSKIGLIPDCGGTYLLPRAMGLHKAKELMFTADLISSDDAKQYGFVNYLVEDEDLTETTYKFAKKLASSVPVALRFIKKILNQSYELSLDSALKLEASLQSFCIQTKDSKEGIQAFKQKRAPVFIGK
jgi:2-(1,2-epoxy-1,2-dihydrophenyl)acetyl-CoA isomerase